MSEVPRRQVVLDLLAEGHRLVDGINSRMTEIEDLLNVDNQDGEGAERNGGDG